MRTQPITPTRFKPHNIHVFRNPPASPSGAKLMAYEWKYELEEYIDQRGENVIRRKSDWSKAEISDESGRAIVHQFQIKTPGGTQKIVSAESALEVLGYTDKATRKQFGNLKRSLQTLAKLKMQRENEQAEIDHKNKKVAAAKNELEQKGYPEITFKNTRQAMMQRDNTTATVFINPDIGMNAERNEILKECFLQNLLTQKYGVKNFIHFISGKFQANKVKEIDRKIEKQENRIQKLVNI